MRNSLAMVAKASLTLLVACTMFIVPSRAQAPAANPGGKAAPSSAAKPVVVELFTAEGCSDCPPAEALALRMEKQPIPGVDLIVLEEHVDYWNQYGWVDPFSSMEWTDRQRTYVSKGADKSPYTPEMVVDGQSQFVGSNARAAQAAIEKAASEPETNVTITDSGADPKGGQEVKIAVGKLNGATAGDAAEVWLAVTEDGLHSSVKAGENAGKTLYHAAVLRSLKKIGVARGNGDEAFTGTTQVKFKSGWNTKDLHIVVFVQDKKSLKILGAASVNAAS